MSESIQKRARMINNSQKIKKRIFKNFNHNVKEMMDQKSLLAQGIKRYFVFEGDKLGVIRADGTKHSSPIQRVEASTIVKKENISSDSVEDMMEDLSTQLADAQSKMLLDVVSDAAQSVGNTVNAGGSPPSPEILLEMIEKIQIDFEGEIPNLPTVVCSPGSIEKFKLAYEQMMTAEPYKSNYEALIQAKKRDFDEREASRKLVD